MTQTIEQLTARVRELEEFKANVVKECASIIKHAHKDIAKQLAASQAYAEQLLEALTTCVCAMQDYQAGIGITEMFDKGERLGRKALALPHSTSALDAYVAEKTATYKSISNGAVVGYRSAQIEIATLTKQRDLAVDALEWIASSLPQIGVERVWMLDHAIKTLLAAIKESEGKLCMSNRFKSSES